MSYSFELIEIYMRKKGISTFVQVSKAIPKLSQPNISEIRSGERHLTEDQALHIAEECGLEIGEVLVKLHIERTKSEKAAESYKAILKKIAGAIAGIVLTLGMMGLPASDAQASPAR